MTDFEKLTDDELLEILQKGESPRAEETLIERYKPMVIKLSRKFYLAGSDLEDAIAEGTIGVYKAIKNYETGKEASFSTFCYVCITRQLLNALKRATSNKNKALNESLPLDKLNRVGISTEEVYLNKEEERTFLDMLAEKLSRLEFKALMLYLDGKTNGEIARELDLSTKGVENALYRARKKIIEGTR